MRFTTPFILALYLSSPAYAIHDQIGEYQNLEDITTDLYQEANEGLQPEYLEEPTLPNIKPLECGIERETPESAFLRVLHGSEGLVHYHYDLNGDQVVDAEISIPLNDPNRYPLFYAFDRDSVITGFHGPLQEEILPFIDRADIVYRDSLRDGSCRGIVVHWVPKLGNDLVDEPFNPQGEL